MDRKRQRIKIEKTVSVNNAQTNIIEIVAGSVWCRVGKCKLTSSPAPSTGLSRIQHITFKQYCLNIDKKMYK
jgi:hypothetical protein